MTNCWVGVRYFAAGTCQHSQSWFWIPSGPTTISLFFPGLLCVLKWGIIFKERRGLATTCHFPLYWGWLTPPAHSFSLLQLTVGHWPLLFSLRYGPHRKHSFSCSFYCCSGNVFTMALPSNGRLFWFNDSGFQLSHHNIFIPIYIVLF
jgi:hypothetical protein